MKKNQSPELRKIVNSVCNNCSVTSNLLFRDKHARKLEHIVRARQMLVAILWNEKGLTNYAIRDILGYKNHASVIHARKQHEQDNKNNFKYRKTYGKTLLDLGIQNDYSIDIGKQLKEQKKINNVLKRLYENEKKDCERIKKELASLRKKYLL
tara:strand:- start:74 stop:532 length:459 start_codon:yes stop_codon:yes gene_type:complete